MNNSAFFIKRQAVSEIVAALLIMSVVAGVSFLALGSSAKQITLQQKSVNEILEGKNSQILELLSVISYVVDQNKTNLELFNYGQTDIKISRLLVDGLDANYTIHLQNGTSNNNTIPQKVITMIEVSKVGKSIQIITGSGNLIDIPLI